jgi:predicted Zn-dependent peptidase
MTDQAVGAELADWYAMTGEYRNFFRHPERVMRVSAEEVQRLARERLRAENRTVAVVRGKS